jgi:hypothetical protein
MIKPRHFLGTALVISWALLLSARYIAAASNSAFIGGSYEASLEHIGYLLPVCAWVALAAGVFLLSCSGCCKSPKGDDIKWTETPPKP